MKLLLLAFSIWFNLASSLLQNYCSNQNLGIANTKYYKGYQSLGACSDYCKALNDNNSNYKYAVVQDHYCWCSDSIPDASQQSSLDQCNEVCPGYGYENCGNLNDGLYGYLILEYGYGFDTTTTSTSSASTSSTRSSAGSSAKVPMSSSSIQLSSSSSPQYVYTGYLSSSASISKVSTIMSSTSSSTSSSSSTPSSSSTSASTSQTETSTDSTTEVSSDPTNIISTLVTTRNVVSTSASVSLQTKYSDVTTTSVVYSYVTVSNNVTASGRVSTILVTAVYTASSVVATTISSIPKSNNGSTMKSADHKSYWDSPGKIVGTFVPVGVVILIILIVIYWFLIWRPKKKERDFEKDYIEAASPTSDNSNQYNPFEMGYEEKDSYYQKSKRSTRITEVSDASSENFVAPERFDSLLDPSQVLVNSETNHSEVSLADDVDYSRKVLKVINEL